MTNYTGEGILSPVFIPADRAVMLDPELSKGAKELYCLLRSFLRLGEISTIKYVITLAEMLHKCERSIQYALAELHNRGVIERRFRYRSRSNGDRRRNLPSEFVIIGGNAPCYAGNTRDFYKKISPDGEKNCTPKEDIYISKNNSITINREVELPEKISASEEEIKTSEEISASKTAEEKPVRENLSDNVTAEVPDILKTTALYLLMRSGRNSLSPQEIKILKVLFKTERN